MPSSNLAIKSYTQPSCTLQILDLSSSSSKWGGSSTQQLQFELHFNDLKQLQEGISIGGDLHQLASLHEVVTNYVQNLLGSSPDHFNTVLSSQTNLASEPALSSHPPDRDYRSYDVPEVTNVSGDASSTGEIFLQQSSGLFHNLFLGTGATQETGQIIRLTMLQLFDLATALDEYAADVLTTTAFSRPRLASSTPSTTWASIAAMLLLGVGLTAAVVQVLNSSDEQPQTVGRSVTPRSNSNQQAIALKPSPTPQLSSPDTLPSLPPVSTSNRLPTASPSSSIPPTTGGLAGTTTLPLPRTTQAIPSPPPVPTTKTTPISSLPSITQAPPILKPTGQQQGSISTPKATAPELGRVTTLPGINTTANIPSPLGQKISPPKQQTSGVLEDRSATITESNAQPSPRQRLTAALRGQASDTPSRLPNRPPTASKPKTTALVSTPQAAEVRDYFVKNWEPPSNLNQTLEYSIVLDVDGSIQRIEPLGKAARTYVDRSGMPLIGEPFVSPNSQGATPRIRVVLSPDGNVQTFVEPN